jgi:2-succinyl-6-hydroxy-2,4-cyclohexadiene-1-carboxylate synthase
MPINSETIQWQHEGAVNENPVILLHGLGASRHDWDLLIPQIARTGRQTFALDLLGHGESAKPRDPNRYHIEQLFAHLYTWVEKQSIHAPAIFIGHSMGGFLSLLFALRYPERVKALTLVDPLYSPAQLSPITVLLQRYPQLGAKAMEFAPEWLIHTFTGLDPATSKYFSRKNRERIAEDYKRASPNILYLANSFFDLKPHLSRINVPALVLWGASDRTLMPESFPQLVGLLDNAYGTAVAKAGHQPHLSHAEQVNASIMQFLLTLDDPSSGLPWLDHTSPYTTIH